MKKPFCYPCCLRKLRKWMFKLCTVIFFFGVLMPVKAQASFQNNESVKLSMQNATLKEILWEIEKFTGFVFAYNADELARVGKVSVQIDAKSIQEALDISLKGTGLTYVIEQDAIVIRRAILGEQPSGQQQRHEIVVSGRVTDMQGDPLPAASIAVKDYPNGTITNNDGRYSIKVHRETEFTVLVFSFMGKERLEMNITARTDMVLNVPLKDKENALQEVTYVATGYQKVNRQDMVGATTTVDALEILQPNYASIDHMLQGVVPGMVVANRSSRVGTSPSIQIRGTSTLLGDVQPLWVVDGIIQEDPIQINATTLMSDDMKNIIGNQVSWLNPQDVETITVLKDASATAIYGAKASNGVIVITTKQAKGNIERLTLNYNSSFTVNTRPNYGQFNLMNSQERMRFSDEAFGSGIPYSMVPLLDEYSYEGVQRRFIEGYIDAGDFQAKRAFLETTNTDWFDLLTRTGIGQNHNLSVMGGSAKASYMASGSYAKQQGQEVGNDSERFTGRLATNYRFNDRVRLNVAITGSHSKNTGFGTNVSPLAYATATSRAIPAHDENGDPAYYQKLRYYSYNTSVPSLSYNFINERDHSGSFTENTRIAASADFSYSILPWLSYNFTGGYNYTDIAMESYMGEDTYYIASTYRGYDAGTALPGSVSFKAAKLPFGGELFTTDARQSSYNIQNKISISSTFRERDRLNILLGQELRSASNISTANTVWGYSKERGQSLIMPTLPENLASTSSGAAYNGFGILEALYNGRWKRQNQTNNFMSLFATLAYAMDNKYIFNASVRNDFSNRFGQNVNNRLDPTYSFGVSWNATEEEFVKNNIVFLTQFRPRVTYGIQGNALTSISPELILIRQNVRPVFDQYYSTIGQIPNPNLKWERTTNWNVGADIQLLSKIGFTFDYYTRRSNAVVAQDIPYEFGIVSTVVNGGIIYNKGVEGTLSFAPVNNKDMGLAISINSSKNWNKTGAAVEQVMLPNFLNGKQGTILKEGYPVDGFWSYSLAGLDPANGSPIFNLLDTPAETAMADPSSYLVYSGQASPDFSGGLSFNFRYKALSVSSSFALILGGKKRLPNPYANFSNGTKLPMAEYNVSKTLNRRWQKPGDELTTDIPSINVSNGTSVTLPDGINSSYPISMWAYSSAMVVDASFLRCRSIDVSWRFNERLLQKLNIKSLKVSATVNNVFVITSDRFNGFDPELNESVMPKAFSFGFAMGI